MGVGKSTILSKLINDESVFKADRSKTRTTTDIARFKAHLFGKSSGLLISFFNAPGISNLE